MKGRRVGVDCGLSAEEGEAGVALTEHSDTFEMTDRRWEIERAAVLGDDKGTGREERSGTEESDAAIIFVGGSIRRIEENDIESRAGGSVFRGEALQTSQSVKFEDSRTAADAEGIKILLN